MGLELGLKYVQGLYIPSVNKFECVKYYLPSNTPEVGLELGLKYVQGLYILSFKPDKTTQKMV